MNSLLRQQLKTWADLDINNLRIRGTLTHDADHNGANALGDLLVGTGTNMAPKSIGTEDQVLSVQSGDVQWVNHTEITETYENINALNTPSTALDPDLKYSFINNTESATLNPIVTDLGPATITAGSGAELDSIISSGDGGAGIQYVYAEAKDSSLMTIQDLDGNNTLTLDTTGGANRTGALIKYVNKIPIWRAKVDTTLGGASRIFTPKISGDTTKIATFYNFALGTTARMYDADDDATPFYSFATSTENCATCNYNSSDGTLIFATRLEVTGTSNGRFPYDVSYVTALDSTFVSGQFGTTNLAIANSDNTTTFATLVLVGTLQGFVIQYDNVGQAQWAARTTGTGTSPQFRQQGAHYGNNSYTISGWIREGSLSFRDSSDVVAKTLGPVADPVRWIAIINYDNAGNINWVSSARNTTDSMVCDDIVHNGTDTYYCMIDYETDCEFYDSDDVERLLQLNDDLSVGQACIGTLDNSGNWQSRFKMTSTANIQTAGGGVLEYYNGHVYASFICQQDVLIYDTSDVLSTTLTNVDAGNDTGFIVKFNATTLAYVSHIQISGGLEVSDYIDLNISSNNNGNFTVSYCYDAATSNIYFSNGQIWKTLTKTSGSVADGVMFRLDDDAFIPANTTLANPSAVKKKHLIHESGNGPIYVTSASNVIDPLDGSNKTQIELTNKGSSTTLVWNGTEWNLLSQENIILS